MSREVLLQDDSVLLPSEGEKRISIESGAPSRLPLLDNIHSPMDIRGLELSELENLADEVRKFLISSLSRTGGHLAPNLGIVEITLALHKVFQIPRDEVIFDVGHQAYVHKILTGRRHLFKTLRTFMRGISIFLAISSGVGSRPSS